MRPFRSIQPERNQPVARVDDRQSYRSQSFRITGVHDFCNVPIGGKLQVARHRLRFGDNGGYLYRVAVRRTPIGPE